LETTGINTLTPEFTLDADGNYSEFTIVQTAPNDVATSNTLRPHRLAVGLYADQQGQLVRTHRVELDVAGERTKVPELVGMKQPALLLINDEDLTYCKLRLDEHSLASLRTGGIVRLTDSLPRALCWSAAWDMTRDGELATRDYVALVLAGAGAETDIGVLQSLNRQALRALEIYADPDYAPQGFAQLADHALTELRAAEPGSDHQLAWLHALLGAARSDEHAAFIQALLDGTETIDGLKVDHELRWAIVQALSARGAIGPDDIAAELERDPSTEGQKHATTARALQPTPEAKAEAWRLAVHDDELPNAMQVAVIAGFAHPLHGDLLRPYVERYFAEVPDVFGRRTVELAQKVAVGMFPTWTSTISPDTVAAADEVLARDDLPGSLRRLVNEGRADVLRALKARAADR
jgi:aminopeptidase N